MATRAEPVIPSWKDGTVMRWLTTVDHKKIGIMYIVASFLLFFAGGIMALLMRAQLSHADNGFITQDAFNTLFTMHGTVMLFLFLTPMFVGFGNYFVPLMIGARDMAFPFLNALSYWVFLVSCIVIFAALFVASGAPMGGWTAYAPLSAVPEAAEAPQPPAAAAPEAAAAEADASEAATSEGIAPDATAPEPVVAEPSAHSAAGVAHAADTASAETPSAWQNEPAPAAAPAHGASAPRPPAGTGRESPCSAPRSAAGARRRACPSAP